MVELQQEEWRDIVGYEGLYKISNFGAIKSVERFINDKGGIRKIPEKILKKKYNKKGYLITGLRKNKKQKGFFVHRLVAYAFIPNPENKPFINHKNGDKTDNRVENLEWVTHSENVKHAYDMGLMPSKSGTNNGCNKLSEEDVVFIREHYIPFSLDFNRRKMAEKFNVSVATIKAIVGERLWKHLL